jgi:thiol-disulfide isomerase/thioredoxin
VSLEAADLVLGFDHYESAIKVRVTGAGGRIDGEWRKHTGVDKWAALPLHGNHVEYLPPRFRGNVRGIEPSDIEGRWAVRFAESKDAVGDFRCKPDSTVTGTFLTPGGDYGYLAGNFDGQRLRLSGFDGSHAFLFDAKLQPDGTLAGDFWSRDAWHETWTAKREPAAALPDGFQLTKAKDGSTDFSSLSFRDLDGKPRTLAEFGGKVVLIDVFGSWCPNCHDASEFLNELYGEYKSKGLSVVGLAFEMTGEFEHDATQVRRFIERHKSTYPVLIAGTSDKKVAAAALPMLEELKAYPTFIFMTGDGRVIATYTGFSGPATGDAYAELRRRFKQVIADALGSP